jgi:hypothetical protein
MTDGVYKMYATKNNANWNSVTFEQGVGETDWAAYQVQLTGASRQFGINTAATTATSLSTYDGFMLQSGQTLLLSTNGTTLTSGTAGVITTTAGLFPAPTLNAGFSSASLASLAGQSTFANGYCFKPDGTKLWRVSSAGTLQEYDLSTPFNITTAVLNGRTYSGFCNTSGAVAFTSDGLTMATFIATGTLAYYILGIAWDITTAGGRNSITIPTTTLACRQMRISPDGNFLIGMSNGAAGNTTGQNAIRVWQIPTPNVLGSIATSQPALYLSSTFATTASGYGTFDFTPDGKVFLVLRSTGTTTPAMTLLAYACTIPWNPSAGNITQIGSNFNVPTADFPAFGATTGMGFVMDSNGTNFMIMLGGTPVGLGTYNTNINTKYNVNISSFGLSAAPIRAYYQAPRVFVDMEAAPGQVSLTTTEQDFISGTTSQVIFGANGTNLLAAGNPLRLNNNNTVTTTTVTQGTANGLPARQINGTGATYIFASGVTANSMGLPLQANAIRLRPDGSSLYVVNANTNVIYQYNLSTPWNLTTASLFNIVVLSSSITGNQSFINVQGIEFNATGTRMFLNGNNQSTSLLSVFEFTLSVPYQIGTAIYLRRRDYVASSSFPNNLGGRFNETGTQFYFLTLSAGGVYQLQYMNLSTPYDTSTMGSLNAVSSGNANVGTSPPTLTPGGNFIFVAQNFSQLQFINTANNIASFNVGYSCDQDIGAINYPVLGTVSSQACDFSPDGMRMFAFFSNGNIIRAYRVRTRPLTQYTAQFATQATTTTSVFFPDNSVEASITASLSGSTMNFATSQVLDTGRAVGLRVNSPFSGTDISNVTLNLWKS